MHHNPLEPPEPVARVKDPIPGETLPLTRDPRVEEYLARVLELLPRDASSYREEQHLELAAHLDALIAAHVELGCSRESAVQATLEQFGDADRLGRQLSHAWKRSAPATASPLQLAAVGSLFAAGLALAGFNPHWPAAILPDLPGLGTVLDLLVPCLAGLFWGRHQPVGRRWLFTVLLPVLVGSALLPIGMEAGLADQELLGRVLLLCRWGIVTGSAAGLVLSLDLLAQRFRTGRPA